MIDMNKMYKRVSEGCYVDKTSGSEYVVSDVVSNKELEELIRLGCKANYIDVVKKEAIAMVETPQGQRRLLAVRQ